LSFWFEAVVADASDLGKNNAPQTVVRVAIAATVNSIRQCLDVLCLSLRTVADRIVRISGPPSVLTAVGSLNSNASQGGHRPDAQSRCPTYPAFGGTVAELS
jgi:hypothetical protein